MIKSIIVKISIYLLIFIITNLYSFTNSISVNLINIIIEYLTRGCIPYFAHILAAHRLQSKEKLKNGQGMISFFLLKLRRLCISLIFEQEFYFYCFENLRHKFFVCVSKRLFVKLMIIPPNFCHRS